MFKERWSKIDKLRRIIFNSAAFHGVICSKFNSREKLVENFSISTMMKIPNWWLHGEIMHEHVVWNRSKYCDILRNSTADWIRQWHDFPALSSYIIKQWKLCRESCTTRFGEWLTWVSKAKIVKIFIGIKINSQKFHTQVSDTHHSFGSSITGSIFYYPFK